MLLSNTNKLRSGTKLPNQLKGNNNNKKSVSVSSKVKYVRLWNISISEKLKNMISHKI